MTSNNDGIIQEVFRHYIDKRNKELNIGYNNTKAEDNFRFIMLERKHELELINRLQQELIEEIKKHAERYYIHTTDNIGGKIIDLKTLIGDSQE